MTKKYLAIVEHYEACFREHGDTHRGVDWPKAEDVDTRYRVMLDSIRTPAPVSILDFGCGAGHMLEYIRARGLDISTYHGWDLSSAFIELCRKKFPGVPFGCGDVLAEGVDVPAADYVIMNGVLTEKRTLSFEEMWDYAQALLTRLFSVARVGIAFNVMSKQVDWERDDLFHLPLDTLAFFLTKQLSRRFVVRNDYGLYEYTTYVYK